ncbi:MAG: hypothetical protein WKH64_17660 [Chloroflexia bacterium]
MVQFSRYDTTDELLWAPSRYGVGTTRRTTTCQLQQRHGGGKGTEFLVFPPTPPGCGRCSTAAACRWSSYRGTGWGHNIFVSPCFERLNRIFAEVFFCSSVNAYTTIFHESGLIRPLYCGGVNG